MKNRFATIVLVSIIGLTGMGLVSCGEPSPNAQYTGNGVTESVKYRHSTKYSLRKCSINVAFPDGSVEKIRVSSIRSSSKCKKIRVGGVVSLEKGKIVSYDKK